MLKREHMELPPPHVLARLDALIVGQEAKDGGGSGEADEGGEPSPRFPGPPRHVLLQNWDDDSEDDDADAAFGIEAPPPPLD